MATIEDLEKPSTNQSPGFREIVEAIRPAVEQSKHENGTEFAWDLLQRAVRANIRASIDRLTHGSKLLGQLVRKEELSIVGAEYSLATGVVEFLPALTNDT
jgi:carbonic anhydrase